MKTAKKNPFYKKYDTKYGVPPFDKIKEEHFIPAFEKGIKLHKDEIDKILSNKNEATFDDSILTLEKSGAFLDKVSNVFYNLLGANTNEKLQKIAKKVSPMLTEHSDNIMLNTELFKRIKAVYEKKDKLNLSNEQKMLLKEYYKNFVRSGANLSEEKKLRLREINKQLSLLSLKFGENVLKENNKFKLIIEKKEKLAGLPESVVESAAEAAKALGYAGKWVFTLHKPSLIPFLQYSKQRQLREKIFKAYINRCNHNDELDNKKIASKMALLRLERAKLLGYKTHAHYVLEENMAKEPKNVYELLNKIWKPALEAAKEEVEIMQKIIAKERHELKLKPWDWWYYAEKVKKQKYAIDDEAMRPYFEINNVRKGAFMVANKLYGITFKELTGLPKPHPDAKVFEVKESDGSHIGILYMDFFPRESKRGGAWMNTYRKQSNIDKEIHPIATNVFNFTKPAGDKPALLSIEETQTLFHEFGHALHGLLSTCTYKSLSGTSVPRDFVELPSQIMEHWAIHPKVMKMYAKHYKTDEPIPDSLIEKIKNAKYFNQGFTTVEYIAASFLDMNWHTIKEAKKINTLEFEEKSLNKIGLIPEIVSRYRSTYFRHIFSGGYSSGYYSYIWSEVLDTDAFEAFKETGIFNKDTAKSLRENIISRGGTAEPMDMYIKFRGREPEVTPLLKKKGFLK